MPPWSKRAGAPKQRAGAPKQRAGAPKRVLFRSVGKPDFTEIKNISAEGGETGIFINLVHPVS